MDDNNSVLKECRTAGALGVGVGRQDADRALYDALDELHEYLNQHRRDQNEYLEEVGRRPHSASGGDGLFR